MLIYNYMDCRKLLKQHEENVPSINIVLDDFYELRVSKSQFLEKHIILFTESVCVKNESPSTVLISLHSFNHSNKIF